MAATTCGRRATTAACTRTPASRTTPSTWRRSGIGGNAWEQAGPIWYETLRDPRLKPTAQFKTFARLTLRAVQRLGYAHGSPEFQAVQDAWGQVGITI